MDEKVVVIEEDGVKEILSISRAGKYIAELKKEIARLNGKAEGYRLDYFAANKNIDKLKAEIAELKTPDLFGSLPNLHSDLDEALTDEPNYEVICIERYKKLPDIFVVWGPTDEEGYGYEIVEHNTEQEAEAFAKSLKVER